MTTTAAKDVEEKFGLSPLQKVVGIWQQKIEAENFVKDHFATAADSMYDAKMTALEHDLMAPVLFPVEHFAHPVDYTKKFNAPITWPGHPLQLISSDGEINQEGFGRSSLERHLHSVGFTQNTPRLAELLWLGTEVCCLNLRRRNKHWEVERQPARGWSLKP